MVPMTISPPKLMHLSMMARRLRVPHKWLRAEAEEGRLPHLAAGNQILFDPEAVEAALVERARQDPRGVDPNG